MFSSVTSWLGGVQPDADKDPAVKGDPTEGDNVSPVSGTEPTDRGDKSTTIEGSASETTTTTQQSDTQADFQAEAMNAAKEWGSYLYSFGKAATDQVAKTAKQLKDTVEEKTIIGDFHREQDKFVSENKEKKNKSEAAVPPWVGYNEEETMKKQILALSEDKRNFLRNPPGGVQFQFDFQSAFPIAMATLQEDANLNKMRFDLVPKQVKEDIFWRNYFYRVSLIKQSAQLTSLAQHTDKSPSVDIPSKRGGEEEEVQTASPPDHEFVSDTYQDNQINDDDLKAEMQQLRMSDDEGKEGTNTVEDEDIPEWEKELQAELQEYEVVNDGKEKLDDDDDLENEILQQIEAEANGEKQS